MEKFLREKYKKRFEDIDSEKLFLEYDKMNKRIESLGKRYDKIKRIYDKKGFCYRLSKKGKQNKTLLDSVKEEKNRRKRAFNILLYEIEKNRNILIESIFINEYLNKN